MNYVLITGTGAALAFRHPDGRLYCSTICSTICCSIHSTACGNYFYSTLHSIWDNPPPFTQYAHKKAQSKAYNKARNKAFSVCPVHTAGNSLTDCSPVLFMDNLIDTLTGSFTDCTWQLCKAAFFMGGKVCDDTHFYTVIECCCSSDIWPRSRSPPFITIGTF